MSLLERVNPALAARHPRPAPPAPPEPGPVDPRPMWLRESRFRKDGTPSDSSVPSGMTR
jgi:hypothetical protein